MSKTLDLMTETPSASYESYDSITASINVWTNEAIEGKQLGTKNVNLLVPAGQIARLNVNFTVDDWGYIKATRIADSTNGNDTTPMEFLIADMAEADDRRGAMGGHTRWGVTNKSIELPAGRYVLEISQTNQVLSENNASVNVSYCDLSISVEYIEAKLRYFTVTFSRSSDVVNDADKNTETASYCSSGYVFKGELIGHFCTGDSLATFTDVTTKSYGLVQTGGWMANASPWVKKQVKTSASASATDTMRIDVTKRFNAGMDDRTLWPDTCCPGQNLKVHTYQTTGLPGYGIDEPTPSDSSHTNHPDYLRADLEIHQASRIGSEGCISVLDAAKWQELRCDMDSINADTYVPDLLISYAGAQPDPFRHPEGAEVDVNN